MSQYKDAQSDICLRKRLVRVKTGSVLLESKNLDWSGQDVYLLGGKKLDQKTLQLMTLTKLIRFVLPECTA